MRIGERLDAWEIQDAIEYQQELKPFPELDGETEYDDDRIETTHDAGGTLQGPQSSGSFDGMSSVDGASSYAAPRNIPFSQCVPFFPVPKSHPKPLQQIASPDIGACPTDPEAEVEWDKNKLKCVHEHILGIQN